MRLAAAVVAAMFLQTPDPAFRVLERGSQSGIEVPRQVVATTADQFNSLWRAHSGRPRPAIDFSQESVVGIFLGTRPTAGYGVEILAVVQSDSGTLVRCRETTPAADAMTAQVMTFPYVIVAVRAGVLPFHIECAR